MSTKNQVSIEQFDLPHPSGEGMFQISVSRVPALREDTKNVPVMFVMDGDVEFALAAEIAHLKGVGGYRPAPMVVGVGYGVTDVLTFTRLRTADLTTPLTPTNREALGKFGDVLGRKDGGAEALLSFILDTLAPEIQRRYPEASANNHILFGHSLGGLFVSYALLTRPESFATFLAVSPALYWDGFSILSQLPAFAKKLKTIDRKPRVLLTCGACEQDLPTSLPEGTAMTLAEARAMIASSRMIDAMYEFAASLRDAGLKEVVSTAFAEEEHLSVVPAAMMRGMTFAVPNPA